MSDEHHENPPQEDLEPTEPAESSDDADDARGPALRRAVRWLFLSTVIVFLGVYLLSGICVVKPEQEALVTRFGKLRPSPLPPGTHYRIPYPVDRVYYLRPNQVKSRTVGGRGDTVSEFDYPIEARADDGEFEAAYYQDTTTSEFLTGDENIIHITLNVQYKVGRPARYLFSSRDPGRLVEMTTETALTTTVAQSHVDDLLTSGKQWVLAQVKQQAQGHLDRLGAGVAINSVTFADVSPPAPVVDAFKDVASALEDRDRLINEARGDYNEAIPRARGEADQQVQDALADKKSEINRARGDADRFLALYREYRQTGKSQASLTRLYLETLEEMLPMVRKYIVDAGN